MTAAACPLFGSCSSSLCPIDPQSLEHAAWFPDESTCARRDLQAPWIARQRKIGRVTGGNPQAGCYSIEMLAHSCVVTRGLRGLDPDLGPVTSERVQRWISAHPAPKPRTSEQRQNLTARLQSRAKKAPPTLGRESAPDAILLGAGRGIDDKPSNFMSEGANDSQAQP